MASVKTTARVAKELGIERFQILELIRLGQLQAPSRFGSIRGAFIWTEDDVVRLKESLASQEARRAAKQAV